jgi:hypothetical protein
MTDTTSYKWKVDISGSAGNPQFTIGGSYGDLFFFGLFQAGTTNVVECQYFNIVAAPSSAKPSTTTATQTTASTTASTSASASGSSSQMSTQFLTQTVAVIGAAASSASSTVSPLPKGHSGLSSGAKAGIGAGFGVGAGFVAAALIIGYCIRKRNVSKPQSNLEAPNMASRVSDPHLGAYSIANTTSPVYELNASGK